MKIAILGATSQIAKDLIVSFSAVTDKQLHLFARHPDVVTKWLATVKLHGHYPVESFSEFFCLEFDAVINFIGVGNPAQAAMMGASIIDVTLKYDELALSYLRLHPHCRYIFLSSGAAYGSSFDEPVDENTRTQVAINHIQPQDWYGVAKLHTECRHRSLPHLPIVDIRVFNYFSHTLDISTRFLITDILRAIQAGETLITSPDNIVRDYVGPDDFAQLISLILAAPPVNEVVDCYTRAPVEKMALLSAMNSRYGLKYKVNAATSVGVNATGMKWNYYSKNSRAARFGYTPSLTSLETVLHETDRLLPPLSPS
jgi:nucleoside-diphosphate-sugar epimerase